ncbi:MAG: hypothetical protein ACYCYI_04970 [Saccharofermentanales bacterium]
MKNNMKISFIISVIALASILIFSSCKSIDVVGNISITSFETILNTIPDKIVADEMNGGWSLDAPDGTARFIWSKDFSKSPIHDVMLEFDAKPFVDAGLDVDKLPEGIAFDDKIMVGTKLGNESLTYNADSGVATPLASYKKIVELKRDSIKYHAALDHYGVDLGNGNVFEWAKDIKTNDKDIVFVLNPKIFIDAGVDPAKVEGWIFAKVEVMDENGKEIEVDKFLKPFNLK